MGCSGREIPEGCKRSLKNKNIWVSTQKMTNNIVNLIFISLLYAEYIILGV